jgi:2-polyprenyl-3-methyl-5-hydroxy-6-metoxy-1,4-benzoquinol methylase
MKLTLEDLPFYWRFDDKLDQHPSIPDRYDFTFSYDTELSLFIEPRDQNLLNLLQQVYHADANIGYMIDGHNLAESYGQEYIDFLQNILGDLQDKKVVDIGCGGCLVLERLKKKGATVLGVDPSPIAKRSAEHKQIELVNTFFEDGMMNGYGADAIIQMDVLEHVFDPVALLQSEKKALSSSGRIIINVPNCEVSISKGDISMAIHQHVNMYTRRSLARVVEAAGLYVEEMLTSNFGSAIFCAASADKSKRKYSSDEFIGYDTSWDNFFLKAQQRIKNFEIFYKKRISEDVGYFVFQRSLPYLSAIGAEPNGRMFDNNTLWHGKYIDGVPSKVENQIDFIQKPTKELLIFSHSFGRQLKDEILRSNVNSTIFTQSDVFQE